MLRLIAALLLATAVEAQVTIDTREPEIALRIADGIARGQTSSWNELFATNGYRDLQERESAMKRPFTDEEFRAFVTNDVVPHRTNCGERLRSGSASISTLPRIARVVIFRPEPKSARRCIRSSSRRKIRSCSRRRTARRFFSISILP